MKTNVEKQPLKNRVDPKPSGLKDLYELPEFRGALENVEKLLASAERNELKVGETLATWIGDARYNRILNTRTFAIALKEVTGVEKSPRTLAGYLQAYRERRFHDESGERFPYLTVSHLEQLAASRCGSDGERLELARRANEKQVSVRKIKHLASQLHQEVRKSSRMIDVVPISGRVEQMDALERLASLEGNVMEAGIFDYQWTEGSYGDHNGFTEVHCPGDPVGHVCECIEVGATKLAPQGLIFLFASGASLIDSQIERTWVAAGLKYAGAVVWQKKCGSFLNADTPLTCAHEYVHLLCRVDCTPKAACGAVSSVTPKWAAPTNAHSGRQQTAVHPFQKPVELMEMLISIATVNGLVVDLFAGSGSAGVAAARRGCPYVGAELVPEYVEIANRRIALAADECEEVVDTINFFLHAATPEEYGVIVAALENEGLNCVQQLIEGGNS